MNFIHPDAQISNNHSEPMDSSSDVRSEDLFNLERLRLSQNFTGMVGVKKRLITVPVRKPSGQDFIRVHPDPGMRLETAVLELKEEREIYLVEPSLWSELTGELIPMVLFTTINRQDVLFLWPIRLPDEEGRQNEWHRSAQDAAQRAMLAWLKVRANRGLGAYEVFEAAGSLSEPEWPDISFKDLMHIAFKHRYICELNHPVLRRLRGEL